MRPPFICRSISRRVQLSRESWRPREKRPFKNPAHLPPSPRLRGKIGGSRIRTYVDVSQRVYSPPPLAARASLLKRAPAHSIEGAKGSIPSGDSLKEILHKEFTASIRGNSERRETVGRPPAGVASLPPLTSKRTRKSRPPAPPQSTRRARRTW